jgi:hypothetical protein
MCDRIREDDERTIKMKTDEKLNKCLNVNNLLEKCLEVNERDFRMCRKEVSVLKECMSNKLQNEN